MKKPGLRTKLDFRFDVEGLEVPSWNFLVQSPKKEKSKTIRVVPKKIRRKTKEHNSKLF